MKRRKQALDTQQTKRGKDGIMGYFRRLALPALGWAALGVGAVLIGSPSRVGLLLSGNVDWWRLLWFAAFVLLLAFGAAAFNDWRRRGLR